MKEFFVTLLSNSSMNFFPDNKTSSFTVQLAEKITLNESWSVGVAEIHYNYNFFNVTPNNNTVKVTITNEMDKERSMKNVTSPEAGVKKIPYRSSSTKPNSSDSATQTNIIKITPGYYVSSMDLVNIVNSEIKQRFGLFTGDIISIDKINNRTQVNKKNSHFALDSISFEARLAMQLGFEPDENILDYNLSPHIGNIIFGVPDQMLIYTDIIEPTYIGHEKAYVLKIVNTNTQSYKFGDTCYKEYSHIHYMRVQKREFESISVDIRDYTGAFLPFQHGVLTIKLHFKKNGSE